jgi:uncharacterized protein (DUF58 family)
MTLSPRSRLLFSFSAVVLPLTLVVAAVPGQSYLCSGLAAIFLMIVVSDAVSARRSLAGIGVALPTVVRMSKDREGKIEVRIQNQHGRVRSLRLALGLPAEIPPTAEEMDILLPEGLEWSRLLWTCTPVKRGNYHIDSIYIEGVSTFGLWAARKMHPVSAEIRVYPNLLTERKSVAALFLNRGAFGSHAVRFTGKGRDFERLREYVPGDSYDEIHWKATARRAKPITKVFQIERTQEVYVVLDASRLSARESAPGSSNLERLVTAALILGLAAERQGDLFGLIAHTDKVEKFVRAKNGKSHFASCRDALYTLQPRTVTPDFDELCSFIRLRLRRRALIVFMTALDDPVLAESFVRNIELIRRQHVVLVNMIRQPAIRPLFTDSNVSSVDDLYGQLGGHLRWQKMRQLEKTLQRRGVHFSLMEDERLSADLITQYMAVKQRQLI